MLAKKPLGDLKDLAPVVSEKSEAPAAPETVTPLIKSPQQELPDLSIQGEGIATSKADSPSIEEAQFVQDEAETQSEDATETNLVQPNPENLDDRTLQPTVHLAEEPKSPPNQDSPPPVSVDTTTLITSQEIPSKQPEAGASPLPVTKILKEGDTLAKLLPGVYGSASPSRLRFVLDHNRHIVNVRKMYPGQQIMFPPLENVESKKMVAEADGPLASDEDKELNSSKKIFARSSIQTKPNGKKLRPNAILLTPWPQYKRAIL